MKTITALTSMNARPVLKTVKYSVFTITTRPSRYAGGVTAFAHDAGENCVLNYLGTSSAEAIAGIKPKLDKLLVRGPWGVMWYEQDSADESFKKGFATREAAEAWARTQPSVRHRYSHAVVYNELISHGLRRAKKGA
jgi:hypothetical protein